MTTRDRGFAVWKVLAIVALVVVLLAIGAIVVVLRVFDPGPVADYERRVPIWGTVAGNSEASKLDDMNIDDDADVLLLASIEFIGAIVGDTYKDVEQTIDTFTYLREIEEGYEKTTYEDEPYLIPYVAEGSDSAVVVIPGGAFGFKSIDGGTGEGRDVALALNERGISAFVLHYRSNPYEFPIPQLDVQRAVRYLRHHADEYGFAPENIGLLGFSAGGYQIGSFMNQLMGQDQFPDDYQPDEVDRVDDSIVAGAMIYPALTFRYNVPMLFCVFDDDLVRDETRREALLDQTDLSLHIGSVEIPQFVSYGTDDSMVGMDGAKTYVEAATEAGAEVEVVVAEGQDHGYKQSYYLDDFVDWYSSTVS